MAKKKNRKKTSNKNIKPIIIGSVCGVLFLAAVLLLIFSDDTTSGGEPDVTQYEAPEKGDTVAEIHVKDYGVIKVRFFDEIAPKAVENFITLAEEGYYDGITWHRVIEDFVIQSGDPSATGTGGKSIWGDPYEDEFSTQLAPVVGALCMANAGSNTNTSQFFIVTQDDTDMYTAMEYEALMDKDIFEYYIENGGAITLYNKHTVFGHVYEGMDVADEISKVEVDLNNKPVDDVIIEKIVITTYQE